MSMSDPLGDMLTRIRNGQSAHKVVVMCGYSKLREAVCRVLQNEGYIRGYEIVDQADGDNKRDLRIELKYDEGQPVIRELKRISRPGRRVYSKVKELPPFYNGLGISVVSTPNGVMADHRARTENVGGEILCQVF